MINKICILCLVLLSLTIRFNFLIAQGESIEQVTIFGSRIKNPVVLDVRTEENAIYFNVNNKSLFPYIFEVSFRDFRNLSPRVFDKKTTILPGNNRLFTFKIIDPNEPPVLSYNTRYYLAKTILAGELFNSYLVPIGRDKTVEFSSSTENGSTKIFIDQFKMDEGDTVFSSRKGIITAFPDNEIDIDRIIARNSLEIRHEDGTIAVYVGLNSMNMEHKLGQVVFPGEPIGVIGSTKILTFSVFEMQDEGKLNALKLLYSGPDAKITPAFNLKGTIVSYPDLIIKKEMTKKEISKFEKHTLY